MILFALQSFCDANDIEGVNWKKIRRLLGKKQKPKKSRPFTTDEIKLMLGVTKELRSKAILLFLSSSGVRREALTELKIGHLKEMPNDCLAVTVYADTDEEYITFINKEAKEALTRYFEKRKKDGESLDPDHPVFRTKYTLAISKPKVVSEKTVSNLVHRAKTNSGINLNDEANMLCHAFRRRFNPILKLNNNANNPLIERLMGHDMKLDNAYFQPTIENLFEEYQKGVSNLVIDDKERVLEEKKKVEQEKEELIKIKEENENWQKKYAHERRKQETEYYTKEQVDELLKNLKK
ncbi:MAG: tyrosine-type recombinase/integrase [Nitrosopumilus sp.]|nr:tyrosine-type recombinase/integrase [Nitrosopumilus sp.]